MGRGGGRESYWLQCWGSFVPRREWTDGTSTCAMHRKGAGLEIGLQVSLERTLTPVTGSDSTAPFASEAPGQLEEPVSRSPQEASCTEQKLHRDLSRKRHI